MAAVDPQGWSPVPWPPEGMERRIGRIATSGDPHPAQEKQKSTNNHPPHAVAVPRGGALVCAYGWQLAELSRCDKRLRRN